MTGKLRENGRMQQLHKLTYSTGSPKQCAAEILESVPTVMGFIRSQMRRHRGPCLSVPQFRTLVFLDRSGGASLSALAEFLGISLPATSRLVEGLVRKRFVIRRIPTENRRVVALALSSGGRKTIGFARRATESQLVEVVASLPRGECAAIRRALRILRRKFQFPGARDGMLQP